MRWNRRTIFRLYYFHLEIRVFESLGRSALSFNGILRPRKVPCYPIDLAKTSRTVQDPPDSERRPSVSAFQVDGV
jgi:hypothetical protein